MHRYLKTTLLALTVYSLNSLAQSNSLDVGDAFKDTESSITAQNDIGGPNGYQAPRTHKKKKTPTKKKKSATHKSKAHKVTHAKKTTKKSKKKSTHTKTAKHTSKRKSTAAHSTRVATTNHRSHKRPLTAKTPPSIDGAHVSHVDHNAPDAVPDIPTDPAPESLAQPLPTEGAPADNAQ